MLDEMNRRLQILEEKFEYQEKTVDALNEVIIDQQAQLSRLEERLSRLQAFQAEAQNRSIEGDDPPPPHY